MRTGTTKWFDNKKGFGFIEQDEGEDLFVHHSEIQMDGYSKLDADTRVKFKVEETDKGLAAINVIPTKEAEKKSAESTQDKKSTEAKEPKEPEVNFADLGLEEQLLSGVKNADFTYPRPIQIKAIPPLIQGRDLAGTAPTGTGKTAAFLLPMFQKLIGKPPGEPRGLVLAPTHELADQIKKEARLLAQNLDLKIESVYGGTDIYNEIERLEERVDILVACPGRLRDHMGRNNIKLRDVEVFVLDEADRMCDMGFLPEIRRIMVKLPKYRQNMFFSATIPPEIQSLADDMLDNPVKISVGRRAPTKTVSHYIIEINKSQKPKVLKKILKKENVESALVFCRTRNTVRNLAQKLRQEGYSSAALQGGMDSLGREATLSAFRKQRFNVLIATNVAARGLDVQHISHVINYDVPEEPDVYTHRLGRTGRSRTEGKAYTLATKRDSRKLNAIEKTIGYEIERKEI